MHKLLIVPMMSLFGILLNFVAISQSLRSSISMPYISMSAYSTKQIDPFSFTGNQAALTQVKNAGVGIYGERRFLLAENSVYALAAAIPTKLGNFGVQINYAGFQQNRRQCRAARCARG